jgi:hypothetical protein
MIAAWTTLDTTVTREGVACRDQQKYSEGGIDADDHHQVMRMSMSPTPAGRPHHRLGVDPEDEDQSDDYQGDA